jgi:hypothetical protein
MQNISSSAAFADSKPHYELLDGLRGTRTARRAEKNVEKQVL